MYRYLWQHAAATRELPNTALIWLCPFVRISVILQQASMIYAFSPLWINIKVYFKVPMSTEGCTELKECKVFPDNLKTGLWCSKWTWVSYVNSIIKDCLIITR